MIKSNILRTIALIFVVVLSTSLSAQKKTSKPDETPSDLTARATGHVFNPFAEDYGIVQAAGMELLEMGENDELINDLIDYAHQFIGTRYRRGGKTPGAFDCSGFTYYVFSQFGYTLSPNSRTQALQGEAVSDKYNVIPGDILVFSGRRGGSIVGHVGIAIDVDYETGDITFIHASTSNGITIDNTSSAYYASRYLGARRIIGIE